MNKLSAYDIERVIQLKTRINSYRSQIKYILKDTNWKELANIPEFKLEAIIQYKEQNGGTLMEAKAKVESYLSSPIVVTL